MNDDALNELREAFKLSARLAEEAKRHPDAIAFDSQETLDLVPVVSRGNWAEAPVLGIPCIIDKALPKGTIEARRGDEVLGRIENVR